MIVLACICYMTTGHFSSVGKYIYVHINIDFGCLFFQICVLCNHFEVGFSPTFDYISAVLYMSTTTINPLMYGLFRRKYRRKVWRKVIKLLSACRQGNRVHPHVDIVGKDEIPAVQGDGTGRSSDT